MHGTENNPVQGKNRGRIRLHEASALNDITYRGPLNCRFFQILGWFCIVVSQVVVMASPGSRFSPPEDWVAGAEPFLSRVADLALPFLLIANFSLIMNGQKSFRTLLLKNLSAAAGLFAAFTLILGHFITETLMLISQDPTQVPSARWLCISSTRGPRVFSPAGGSSCSACWFCCPPRMSCCA